MILSEFANMNGFFYVFGAYSIISAIFYYYPVNINKMKKAKLNKKKKFYVISHRGGAGESVENTVAAFDYSKSIDVDIIEIDCHMTKDGKVVVCHDPDLYRICGIKKLIKELNYDEIPDIDGNSIDSRSKFPLINNEKSCQKQNILNNEDSKRMPLLETLFLKYPDIPMNIDIKDNNDELINKVFELIKKYNRENLTIWGSFMENVKRRCHRLDPSIPIYFSKTGCIKLFFSTIFGILPFLKYKESYLEIVMPNYILKEYSHILPFPIKIVLKIAKKVLMRKSFIKHLQENHGITVFLWVLNTDDAFETAVELGVDGIITDYPQKLINYLKENHPHLI